ncbi:hypothetical protein BDN72DRAFT_894536 [Pluteus cervinus]|uniref:Uncharacterized protein n=1 Tax=Pluteus cervinus TaxID=181527 RepID=A0ACD3B511_9AGAR|nr:hypothetical protein BDN72DRAFT_894536 [Pluteus cervinus]
MGGLCLVVDVEQISRSCCRIIETDLKIAYKVALASASMVDNVSSGMSLVERSRSLQHFVQARQQRAWAPPVIIGGPSSDVALDIRTFTLTSSVVAFLNGVHVSCIDISCASGSIRQWDFELDDIENVKNFQIDPGQNLLILSEEVIVDDETNAMVYHIRSLENGELHPRLSGGQGSIPSVEVVDSDEVAGYDFKIFQTYLLISVFNPITAGNDIVIFDWRSGNIEKDIEGPYSAAAFLNTEYVLCCRIASEDTFTTFSLDVYALHQPLDMPILVFDYPKIQTPALAQCNITILPDGPRPSSGYQASQRGFSADPEECIIWRMFSVFQASAILGHIQAPNGDQSPKEVGWNDWVHYILTGTDDNIAIVFGSRLVNVQNHTVSIFDFDRVSLRCAELTESPEIPAEAAEIPWAHTITSKLIPRISTLELTTKKGRYVADVQIDENSIIIVMALPQSEGSSRMLQILRQA